MNEIKISVGRITADISFNSPKQKIFIEKIAQELNIEFNNLKLKYKGVDDTILLFFLLFKTQSSMINFEYDMETYFLKIFSEISNFVQTEQLPFYNENLRDKNLLDEFYKKEYEKRENLNKLLVAVNIYKKIDYLKIKNRPDNNFQDFNNPLISNFTENIKKEIESINNKLNLL